MAKGLLEAVDEPAAFSILLKVVYSAGGAIKTVVRKAKKNVLPQTYGQWLDREGGTRSARRCFYAKTLVQGFNRTSSLKNVRPRAYQISTICSVY